MSFENCLVFPLILVLNMVDHDTIKLDILHILNFRAKIIIVNYFVVMLPQPGTILHVVTFLYKVIVLLRTFYIDIWLLLINYRHSILVPTSIFPFLIFLLR